MAHAWVANSCAGLCYRVSGDVFGALGAAGLLVAAHPMHAQAVAWVSCQPLVLAAAFALEAAHRALDGRAVVAAALVGCACLCKATALSAPAVVAFGPFPSLLAPRGLVPGPSGPQG